MSCSILEDLASLFAPLSRSTLIRLSRGAETRALSPGEFCCRTPRLCRLNISGALFCFAVRKRPRDLRRTVERISQVTGHRWNKAPRHRGGRRRLTSPLTYLHLIMNVTQRLAESLPMHAGGRCRGRAGRAATTQRQTNPGRRAARHAIRRPGPAARLW